MASNVHIDGALIAYSISFVGLLGLLYWKMRRQFMVLLDAKHNSMQDALETADYIKIASIKTLTEESQKQENMHDDIANIKAAHEKQMNTLMKSHENFVTNLEKQFEKELDEHIKQINGKFIQDMKKEISEIILDRLGQRLANSPMKSPAEQFIANMQGCLLKTV